jgi:hypothetical protein
MITKAIKKELNSIKINNLNIKINYASYLAKYGILIFGFFIGSFLNIFFYKFN